jgi:hypothetical protein
LDFIEFAVALLLFVVVVHWRDFDSCVLFDVSLHFMGITHYSLRHRLVALCYETQPLNRSILANINLAYR